MYEYYFFNILEKEKKIQEWKLTFEKEKVKLLLLFEKYIIDLLHHLNDHKIFFEFIFDDIFSKVESCKFILFEDIYKLSITYELKS